jgi:hypothetical protein
MSDVFQVSKLLNRYYEKVGKAAAGTGQCPRFATFEAGYGFIDEDVPDGETPEILNVPADQETVPGVVYSGDIEAAYSNGSTIAKCVIPVGAVSTPKKLNVFGVYDQDGDLVAVSVTLPDWLTPTEAYTGYPTVNFPMEDVE